jgi:hypothetical protein
MVLDCAGNRAAAKAEAMRERELLTESREPRQKGELLGSPSPARRPTRLSCGRPKEARGCEPPLM